MHHYEPHSENITWGVFLLLLFFLFWVSHQVNLSKGLKCKHMRPCSCETLFTYNSGQIHPAVVMFTVDILDQFKFRSLLRTKLFSAGKAIKISNVCTILLLIQGLGTGEWHIGMSPQGPQFSPLGLLKRKAQCGEILNTSNRSKN